MNRGQRKLDHIRYAMELGDSGASTKFEEVHFLHNCLAGVNPDRVDYSTALGTVQLANPVIIDAITGGTPQVQQLNESLALVARETGCAMAVGSQYGTVRRGGSEESYTIARRVNPQGVLIANVSALATPEEAQRAVAMLDAAALEVHLNVAQELLMPEGDRDFASLAANLQELQQRATVPVVIKETGCGMAREQLQQLMRMGFTCFDLAGAGGTSFAAIEAARSGNARQQAFASWGIPTAWSLLEARAAIGLQQGTDAAKGMGYGVDLSSLGLQQAQPSAQEAAAYSIVASGGIRTGFEAAKALAMGANAVAMAGNVLQVVQQQGVEAAISLIEAVKADIKDIMVLTGSANLQAFSRVPLVYTGSTLDFMTSRGYKGF